MTIQTSRGETPAWATNRGELDDPLTTVTTQIKIGFHRLELTSDQRHRLGRGIVSKKFQCPAQGAMPP